MDGPSADMERQRIRWTGYDLFTGVRDVDPRCDALQQVSD